MINKNNEDSESGLTTSLQESEDLRLEATAPCEQMNEQTSEREREGRRMRTANNCKLINESLFN